MKAGEGPALKFWLNAAEAPIPLKGDWLADGRRVAVSLQKDTKFETNTNETEQEIYVPEAELGRLDVTASMD